jgi:hypothetical protein
MNTNEDLDKSEASHLELTDDLELEGELLTEVCASESTLGLFVARYRELIYSRW